MSNDIHNRELLKKRNYALCNSRPPLTGRRSFSEYCVIVIGYLDKIFETHPCDTLSCRDMSHGRVPLWASSTILCLTRSGNGRPLTNTPPSWFTPPWPEKENNRVRNASNTMTGWHRRRLNVIYNSHVTARTLLYGYVPKTRVLRLQHVYGDTRPFELHSLYLSFIISRDDMSFFCGVDLRPLMCVCVLLSSDRKTR